MCEPGKPCPPKGYIQETYPLLWAFFDGAMSANSGGHAHRDQFEDFTTKEMDQANMELSQLCFGDIRATLRLAHHFGMLADSGYTMWGQTMQEASPGDDDQHKLLAWVLLETRY